MARRLLIAIVVLAVGSSHATSLCPRDLHAVLDSPACDGHRRQLMTTPRATIDSTRVGGDACADSLRALLSSETSLPCTASLATPGGPDHSADHTRRLSKKAFDGKLKCTFDSAAPLNVSDLTQSFIIDCKEITEPYNYTWLYVVLGIVGGLFLVWGLIEFVGWCNQKIKSYREKRLQQAIDEAEAKPAGVPYELA